MKERLKIPSGDMFGANNLSDVDDAATARANIGAGTGDGDMVGANNLSDVANPGTSRGNLGLGTAATQDTGVANGNVPQMDATGYPAADGRQITGIAKYLTFIWDNNGTALAVDTVTVPWTFPADMTILGWRMTCQPSGSVTADLWVAAGVLPTNANTITNGNEPAIAADVVANDADVSGDFSDVAMAAGDVIIGNIDAATTATRASLTLILRAG